MITPHPGDAGRAARAALLLLSVAGWTLAASCGRDPHVAGSGTIEMDEIDVASLVGGRIVSLAVDEGDTVRAGDTLAVLDRGELTAELAAQAAQAERAVAQWRDARAGPRSSEVQAARAEVEAASAQARLAESDLQRIRALFEDRLVSQAELDRARSVRDAAVARRQTAEQQLRLVQSGTRRQQITAAQRAAEAAAAQLSAARSRVGELVLVAPDSGVVLLRNFEPGEIAPAGSPVVTLGDPDRLWMRVYVATPQMGRVRIGAPAEVRVIGMKQAFRGRVVEIATEAEFTPRAALTEEEQANLVFGVKIALEPSGGALKAGLPADARIQAAELGASR